MWKCKYCGGEIIIKAEVKVIFKIFLDENKKAVSLDFIDWSELDLQNYKIKKVSCNSCGRVSENLEELAEWED